MKNPLTRNKLIASAFVVVAVLSVTRANAQLDTLQEYGQTFHSFAAMPDPVGANDWLDTSAAAWPDGPPFLSGLPHGFDGPTGASGEYTITAGGVDFYGNSDSGSFLYDADESTFAAQTGDFSAIVRSVWVADNIDEALAAEWGRSGIMARSNPAAADSPNAYHFRKTGNGGTLLQTRDTSGGASTATGHDNEFSNTPVYYTPIWLGLHRKDGVWYSTWAADDGFGNSEPWSAAVQRAGSPDTQGAVYVGLAHQAHWAIQPEINTALFDNFSVGPFDPDLGDFPGELISDITFGGAVGTEVFLTASLTELGSPVSEDVDWMVEFIGPESYTANAIKADIYLGDNNDANRNALINNTLGTPSGTTNIPNINWSNPGQGAAYGYPDIDPNYRNTLTPPPNLFTLAVPTGGFDLAGDGASNYGVHLTGQVHIPSDADRGGVEKIRFHDGNDDFAFLEVNGVVLINRNGAVNWYGNNGAGGTQSTLDVSAPWFNDGEWVSIRAGMWEGGGADNCVFVWDALDRTGKDNVTGGVDPRLNTYNPDNLDNGDGQQVLVNNSYRDMIPTENLRVPVPAVASSPSGYGQPSLLSIGTLAADTRELRVYINGELVKTVPTLPHVVSAEFTSFEEVTIEISDVGTGGTRDLDDSTLTISRNGVDVTGTVGISRTGTLLTITDNTARTPYTNYSYFITGQTTAGTGSLPFEFQITLLSFPIRDELRAGLAAPPNVSVGWDVMELNAYSVFAGGLGTGLDMFRNAQTVIHDGTILASAQQPYINHSDPDQSPLPFPGDWSADLPILSDTAGPDHQYVTYARTIVTIPPGDEGDFTVRIHGADGYGLRVTGATFTSVAGNGLNQIHPQDRSSVFLPADTADSNAFAVCRFPAPGDYLVEFFGFAGEGPSFQEIAWAPGVFTADYQTLEWSLLGDTSGYLPSGQSPLGEISPFRLPALPSSPGWAMNVWYNVTNPAVDNLAQLMDWLSVPFGNSGSFSGTVVEDVINHNDPDEAGGVGVFTPDLVLPGKPAGAQNRIVMVARAVIIAPVAGDYTIQVRSDDGFLLRWENPGDQFHSITSNGNGGVDGRLHPNQLSEAYFVLGTGDSDTRVSAYLTVGAHVLTFAWWEGVGGAFAELSAAPGVLANNGATFELLDTTPKAGNLYVGIATASQPGLIIDFAAAPSAVYDVLKSPDIATPFTALVPPLSVTTDGFGVGQVVIPDTETSDPSYFFLLEGTAPAPIVIKGVSRP